MWKNRIMSILLSGVLAFSAVPLSAMPAHAQTDSGKTVQTAGPESEGTGEAVQTEFSETAVSAEAVQAEPADREADTGVSEPEAAAGVSPDAADSAGQEEETDGAAQEEAVEEAARESAADDDAGETFPDDTAAEMTPDNADEEAAGKDLSEPEEDPAGTDAAGSGSAAGETPEVLPEDASEPPADADSRETAAPSAGSGSGNLAEPAAGNASSAESTLPDVTDEDAPTEEVSQEPSADAQEEGGRIWFDIPDSRIYSDGTYSFDLHTEDIPGNYTVDLELGHYGDDGLVEAYTQGVEYDFDGTTLTLFGDRLQTRGYHWFGFLVEAVSAQDGHPFCGNGFMFEIRESFADYDFEQDRELLPGWYDTVNHREHVYVENADQPDGQDMEYEVTGVSIERQDPEEAGKDVLDLLFFEDEDDPSGDNYWWHYEGRNRGTAVVRVDYIDLDGNEASYTFRVSVQSDVYGISIDTQDGSTISRPGGTIRLTTDVWHHAVEEENEGTTDGLLYEWRLDRVDDDPDPESFASLQVDSDGRAASVTFRQMTDQEIEDGERYELSAAVSIYKDSVSEENLLDETSVRLTLTDSYRELWPARISSGLEVGQRETVTAQLRSYPGSDGREYDLPEGEQVYYHWYYDDRAVQIYDADGRQVGNMDEETGEYKGSDASQGASCDFTIYRRRPWGTDIFLEARWTDADGNDCQENRRFHLEERNYRAWLDLRDDRVYSDGTLSCPVILEDIPDTAVYGTDYDIDMVVGLWGDDGIKDPFTEGVEYTFDGTTLTIDGEKLAARGLENDREFGAELTLVVGGEPVWVDSWDLLYREARIDYDREWDRDLLPGWDGSVQGINHLFVENSAYPGGEELDYRVLDVELVSDTPLEGEDGPVLIDFHRDQKENDPSDYWWYYRVGNRGEAVLRVTYEDLEGQEQTYEFTLRVGGDVYKVSLNSVDASYDALPGGRFDLKAEGVHEYMDAEGHYQSEQEGFRCDWFFEYGEEYARLEVDPEDPSRATLFCNNLPEGQDEMWEDVRVAVRILDAEGNETSGYDAKTFWISSDYCEILPLLLDSDLDVGCSIKDQSFEVRRYRQGQDGYEVLDDTFEVQYQWYFDEDALTVTETRDGGPVQLHIGETAAGSTFTITRSKPWWTDYHIRAFWTDEDGNERDVWGSFNFRDKHYEIRFENDDEEMRADMVKTFSLNTYDLGGLRGHDIIYFVNFYTGDKEVPEERAEEDFVYLTEGVEYTIASDRKSITINGELVSKKMDEAGYSAPDPEFYIGALLFYQGKPLGDSWQTLCRVVLKNRAPADVPVTKLELVETAEIATTKTLKLNVTIIPEGATNKVLTWTSDDPSIATVDQNGLVKAKKYGKTTITVQSSNGQKAQCTIQTRFNDVNNPGKSYYQPVYWAVDKGITVCSVTFRPEDSVTRGEFVAFLWRVAGKPKSSTKVNFKDVNSSTKFFDAIRWAVGQGIIKGYSDGTFKSENAVTRGETATMIWRYAGKPAPKTKKSPFSDLKASAADSYKAILWGSENGIIKGSGGKFLKNDGCTRGQVVTFLYRLTH